MKTVYSNLERWLHHLALNFSGVKELTHDLERGRFLDLARKMASEMPETDRNLIVCGLARSGTTILLQALDGVGCFGSLTYRDMPFVLAPNLWHQFSRRFQQSGTASERAHGDGILVSPDSPESFEEPFWQLYSPYSLDAKGLHIPEPNAAILARYRDYQVLIRLARKRDNKNHPRYLAKNNNHLARLPNLLAEPDNQVLVVYRNPVDAATSLHRQHIHFTARHKAESFDRRYMRWLAHHEFGLDHAPFAAWAPHSIQSGLAPDNPDYWLRYWIACHRDVLTYASLGAVLIAHDVLCKYPTDQLANLAHVISCPEDALIRQATVYRPVPPANSTSFSALLVDEARAIWEQLNLISLG